MSGLAEAAPTGPPEARKNFPLPGLSQWIAVVREPLTTTTKKRSEIAGSAACRCGSSLLAKAAPRWNSKMGSRAPRIQPSVLREGRIAARLARVMYRYRDCHRIDWTIDRSF